MAIGTKESVGCVALLLLAAAGLWGYASMQLTGPMKPPVKLFYDGSTCWGEPDPVDIWKDKVWSNWFKPHKVTWEVDESVEGSFWWEIVGKGGDDPLGPVDPIECNKKKTKSLKAKGNLPGDPLEWDYAIVVYECTGNNSQGSEVCRKDPRVHIQD